MATHNTHTHEPTVGKTYYGSWRNLRLLEYYPATGWCKCEHAFKTGGPPAWIYNGRTIWITVGDLMTYYEESK